jgi:iron(III) transport system permease protein
MLGPLAYLIARAAGADTEAWAGLLRPRILASIGRTVLLAAAVCGASVLIAVPLAWLTVRSDVPLRRWWSLLTPLPLVMPSYVGAYLFLSAFGPRGMLQQVLQPFFGVERLPEVYGFPGAVILLTLLCYPYVLLSVRASLLQMDASVEEAARSLGCGRRQTFLRVTLPLLRPALASGCLLTALYVVRDFGAVAMLRYDTLTSVIYMQYQSFDRSQAALTALLAVAATVAFLAFEVRLSGVLRQQKARPTSAADRAPAPVALGAWRWPAAAFCAAVVMASLILPAATLGYWLVRGIAVGEQIPELGTATLNSVTASLLGAGATLAVALPLALLVVRHASAGTRLVENAVTLIHGLPGVVAALALVFFGARQAPWLYQTLPLLVAAYGILFVPQALGTLRTTLLHIPAVLEEAACGLGSTPLRAFARITLPLLRPGLVAAASMTFLTVMKELPATLLLSPIGFRTLASSVWSAMSEAFFAQAAAPALLLILMSSVPLAILRSRSSRG